MDFDWLKAYLTDWGVAKEYVIWLNLGILLFSAILLLYIIDLIIQRIFVHNILRIAQKSNTKFDDHLVANKTVIHLSRLIGWILHKDVVPSMLVDFTN